MCCESPSRGLYSTSPSTSGGEHYAYAPKFQAYYGNQEFVVTDPDGYLIAFGHNIAGKKKREIAIG
jgi:hypothetical protein